MRRFDRWDILTVGRFDLTGGRVVYVLTVNRENVYDDYLLIDNYKPSGVLVLAGFRLLL